MAGDLTFDVEARNDASDEFTAIAAQLKDLARQLRDLDGKKAKTSVSLAGAEKASSQAEKIRVDVDKLDGRNAKVKVALDAASTAPITKLSADLKELDGKTAKADVQLTGAEAVKAKVAGVLASLKALPNKVTTTLNIDMDKGVGERLAAVVSGVSKLGSVSQAALPSIGQLRLASQAIVSPGSLPIVERISDAIAGKFHAAVDKARVVVDKLHTGTKLLEGSLLGLGAVGNAVQVIGGLTAALTQLSGATLLIPAAVGGAAVAVGALKIAFAGFSDAVNADTPKKFAKATEDMAPAAKAAVIAVRELKTALTGVGSVGKVVQTNMFDGLAAKVQQLGQVYLPVLKSGLGQTATLFNGMAKSALTAVTSLSAVAGVRTIITNTNTALGAMKNTVANAATGFLTLAVAGSGWLPRFGAAVDAGAKKFDSWSRRIVADGSFDRWVEGGITAFKQLGTIVGNVGSILGSVFSALSASSGGALASFARLTGTVKDFLNSAQGTGSLKSFATTVTAAGDALSKVLGAALKAVAPLVVALGPALQTLATSIGEHLSGAIEAVTPALTRFAEVLSANPDVLANIAKVVGVAAISFGPFVAVLGIAGTLLKGMLLARLAAAAIGALGIQGTVAARVIALLATPLAALRAELPLLARGFGSLVARLLLLAGPIGGLIIAFSTLYATSSQFRAAVDGVAATVGRILTKAFQDAGTAIASTVTMIGDIAGTIQQAAGGFTSLASSVLSVSGPIGELVSGGLSGLSDLLGQLPGTALAAFAAFKVFGLIAPLFATASAAVSGFAARMLAFQGATAAGAIGSNAAGLAAGKFATALSKVGSALPLVGVAVIALGAVYGQFSSIADDVATSVVQGSMSMSGAIEAEYQRIQKNVLFGVSSQKMMEDATNNVRGAVESQLQAMGPLDQANARVQISTKNLADEILRYGQNSPQAADAARVLARDTADLASKQKILTDATKGSTEALKAQADQMQSQIDTALAYGEAVKQTAEAQQAANDALKSNGADSKEYKDSVDALVRAMNTQINAARQQAGALGDTEAATAAYNTEILRTADLTSKAGRDAFTKLVSGLDSTGLAAISSAAKLSGLRTEIVTLPDGRKVTVVVEADRGKLDSVKQGIEDLASKKYIGSITILAETTNARGDITQTVQLADGSRGTIKVDADGGPAILTVGATKYTIDQTTGTLKVLGDVAPGETSLAGLKVLVDSTTGQVSISATAAPATAILEAWRALAGGTFGIPQLDANPALANSVLGFWKSTSDATTGVPNIDAKSGKAEGVLAAWKALANGTTGIPALDSNPGLANQILAAWKARSDATTGLPKVVPQVQAGAAEAQLANLARTRYTTIVATVVAGQSGAVPTATGVKRIAGGAIGGVVHPYAAGAVVEQYAAGGIRPLRPMRGDIAQRVPANTWRVIGDRARGDEFFLPDDSKPRSMKIGAEWAKRRGMALVPRPAGMASGGIRAEDGSTVNAGFYSKTNLTPSTTRLTFIADAMRLGLPTSGGLPPGWKVGVDGHISRVVQIAAPRPPAAPVAAPVRGASNAPSVNLAPLVTEMRTQIRALAAAVAGGGGYDATIAANTARIAANTAGGSAGPSERAGAARFRSALPGVFA